MPRALKDMDARSGGATEADEAGAARSDIRKGIGHSDRKTTSRYVRGYGFGTEPTRRRTAATFAGSEDYLIGVGENFSHVFSHG